MPKICYVSKTFREVTMQLIGTANQIIADFDAQGFTLTLRQLYYQLASRNVIPNTVTAYDNLGSTITDARYAGLIDWEALEDRTRNLRCLSHWDSPGDVIQSAAQSYNLNLWEGQSVYTEVWIEKDALVGVIEAVCEEYDVPYFSCRGYNSASEMWVAAQRIRQKIRHPWRHAVILHLGDHDPSGLDMTRDIADRLSLFSRRAPIEVRRIALNRDQVNALALLPNPAKVTDTRYAAYMKEHGSESWELDALTPAFMVGLIRQELEKLLDRKLFDATKRRQEKHRSLLNRAADQWPALVRFLRQPGKSG